MAEVNDRGFRVLPEIQIDLRNVEPIARDGLGAAELSVHLFGTEHDELAVRQARIAMSLEKPLIAWTSEPELYRKETEYGRFLAELMKYRDPHRRSQYLDQTRLERVKTEVLEILRPRETAPSVPANGKRRVYILCDGHEVGDYRSAWKIKKWIEERDKFEVDLPETAPLDPGDLRADHKRKLSNCDGLLLYWGQAGKQWFETTQDDLQARHYRSGAIALGSPERAKEEVGAGHVIRLYEDFRYEALESFLRPLRQ